VIAFPWRRAVLAVLLIVFGQWSGTGDESTQERACHYVRHSC
jgi:hypothetical protein